MQPQPLQIINPSPPSNLGQLSSISFTFNNTSTFIHYFKNPTILNNQYNHDIIPGIYQGGFQLWQCQIQFIKKIFQEYPYFYQQFKNKKVIQIGCGHGLLGVVAAKLQAKLIVLQDYNQNVIEQLTKQTVNVNFNHQKNNNNVKNNQVNISYLWGDWEILKQQQQQYKYDVILGSQLTYKQQNYQKIINFIKNNMKSNGKCYLANKNYYFGVGGNLAEFKQKLQENQLYWKIYAKIVPKSGGNKKEILIIQMIPFSE